MFVNRLLTDWHRVRKKHLKLSMMSHCSAKGLSSSCFSLDSSPLNTAIRPAWTKTTRRNQVNGWRPQLGGKRISQICVRVTSLSQDVPFVACQNK